MTRVGIVGLVIAMCGHSAHADTIWSWTHEASGSGWANVFDGGPAVFDSDETTGPNDNRMSVVALDLTHPGSLGASFSSSSESRISGRLDVLRIHVDLSVFYSPSVFSGGDRPGGEGSGELFSVIEFIAPSDEIEWTYFYDVDVQLDFDGSSLVVVENVTQEQTLLTLADETNIGVTTMLSASKRDLIRITSEMSGSGRALPGFSASGEFQPVFESSFAIIPEPSSLVLCCTLVYLAKERVRSGKKSTTSLISVATRLA